MPTPVSATRTSTEPLRRVRRHRDRPARRREPHRVVDQVEQHLVHPLAVGVDGRQIGGQLALDDDAAVRARDLDLRQHLRHERRQRHLLAEQRQLAGLQPRELQQLLDQPAEPLRLRQHHLQRLRDPAAPRRPAGSPGARGSR